MKSLVILFAVIVAVTSAARLPEADSRLPLAKLEPVLQRIVDHIDKIKSEGKSEDVYENEANAVPEMSQPKETDDSLEEFRQKPTNLKAFLEKIKLLEKQQQQSAVENSDKEDEEDSDVFLSYGLDKPVKFDDVKKDNVKEIDEDEEEEETEDNIVPISFGVVEEAIDMAKENDPDVHVSYGLAEPIDASALKKDGANEDEEEDDEENESIIPFRNVQEEEQLDDNDVQVSFGLAEPIVAAAVENTNLQEDADDEDDDDDEEDEVKPSDLDEKVMSEIIDSVMQTFAKAQGLKL